MSRTIEIESNIPNLKRVTLNKQQLRNSLSLKISVFFCGPYLENWFRIAIIQPEIFVFADVPIVIIETSGSKFDTFEIICAIQTLE